jgi:hypothetical protein
MKFLKRCLKRPRQQSCRPRREISRPMAIEPVVLLTWRIYKKCASTIYPRALPTGIRKYFERLPNSSIRPNHQRKRRLRAQIRQGQAHQMQRILRVSLCGEHLMKAN